MEGQRGGFIREIRIVRGEINPILRFHGIKQNHPVINGQGGEGDEVNDGRKAVFNAGEQFGGGTVLVRARDGEDHAPMAAQDVRAPGPAAFSLQELFFGGAEFTEASGSGDDDGIYRRHPRVPGNDLPDQAAVGVVAGDLLSAIETGMIEELPGGAGEDETAMGVGGGGFALAKGHRARRGIELIFPQQFIGEGEGIVREIKTAWSFTGHANRLVKIYGWSDELTMLYERWTQISRDHRRETALHDLATGRHWTFEQLFAEGEKHKTGMEIVYPTGNSAEFIIQLIAAWRAKKAVCPLEPGQAPPQITEIPAGIVHFKCTSATAGHAQLVAFKAEQLAADADNIVATMGLRREWPNLGVISLAHSYGFSNLVLPLLLHGIPLVLGGAPLPEIVRQACEREEAMTIPAVPAMWRAWHEAGAIPRSVRLAISAGAPLPVKLEQEVHEAHGVKIHNFLGASECGGIAYDVTETPREDAAMAGTPMQNVELSLDEDGCVVVRSGAVGETYWPEKTPRLGKGVFYSNDLAELKDGRVILTGRMGDVINVAGRKISPETIERELVANPKVRECIVLGLPSREAERMEIIAAVVVSEAGEAELKKFLLDKLPAWQVPREWHFVETLMTSPRGKVSRAEWRRRLT